MTLDSSAVVAMLLREDEHVAAKAFARYGKGRHSARLNYGDCMTYATASIAEHPLLFVGKDFAKTDLVSALD